MMTSNDTDPQATRAALTEARDDVYRAQIGLQHTNTDLARAIRAHITAMTRRSFPAAIGLVIHFPEIREHREWTAKFSSVIAKAPTPLATCPIIWDNTDPVPTAAFPVDHPWWSATTTIEPLVEEYATLTRAHDWPWCDTEGEWRILLFPAQQP